MKQLLLVLIVFLGTVFTVACGAGPTPAAPEAQPSADTTRDATESPLDMPNPASRFCSEQGYQLELRTDASGTTGYCVFPDGSECEEWAFYHGECVPADTTLESPLGLPNPASAHCEEQGYELEMRTDASGTVGYCIFPDGTECEEWAFYRGECGPTDRTFESPLGLANPASVYCEEQGYELEMRTDASGTVGYCIFPDGTECEEWAFYRGDCAPGTTQP